MTEIENETYIRAIVGPQEIWTVVMGTPENLSIRDEVHVEALSDVGAYWAAVSMKPDWYVDRIFPNREAI